MSTSIAVFGGTGYAGGNIVAEAAKRHGVIAGIHTGSVAYTREMEQLGYRFFAYLSELRFMALMGNQALTALRESAPAAATQSSSY